MLTRKQAILINSSLSVSSTRCASQSTWLDKKYKQSGNFYSTFLLSVSHLAAA